MKRGWRGVRRRVRRGTAPAVDEGWDLGADRVYWRRRFLILCAGVVALGVCAWLIPGAHPPPARSAADARGSVAALNKRQVLPATAYGSAKANPAPAVPSVPPSTAPAKLAATHPAAGRQPSRGRARRRAAVRAGQYRAQLVHQPGELCAGRHPAFSVYAVSTAAAACTLPFGAGAARVIVTRQRARGVGLGGMPAPCRQAGPLHARRSAGARADLESKATRPSGCGGSLTAGESGTFDAVAMSHGQSSPVRAFKILTAYPRKAGLSASRTSSTSMTSTADPATVPLADPTGTIAWRKPIRSASATRRGAPATLRTSPARPTSPTTMMPWGRDRFATELAMASARPGRQTAR